MRLHKLLSTFLLLATSFHGVAANITWTNGNGTGIWSDAANWSSGKPGSGDKAIFDGTSTANCTIDENINVQGIDINSGYTGTIIQSASFTITVGSSDFIMDDGVFTGGSGDIDVNDVFTIQGGNFTSTSSTLFVSGNINITSGQFNHNNGTLQWDGTGNKSFQLNEIDTFYNFNLAGTNSKKLTLQSGDTMYVENKLTLTTGRLTGNTAFIEGDLEMVSGLNSNGSTDLWLVGSGTSNVFGEGTTSPKHNWYIAKNSINDTVYIYDVDNSVTFGKSDETLTITQGTLAFSKINTSVDLNWKEIDLNGGAFLNCQCSTSFSGIWDNNGGEFIANEGTWVFDGNDHRVYSSTAVDTFYNLYIDAASNKKEINLSGTDTIAVTNNLTANEGGLRNGTIYLFDTLQLNSGFDNNTANCNFIFSGNLQSDYIDNGGTFTKHNLIIAKTDGSEIEFRTTGSDVNVGNGDYDLTLLSGTMDFSTADIIDIGYRDFFRLGGIINASSATIKHDGRYTVTGGLFSQGTSTWEFDASDDRNYTYSNVVDTFYNIYINSTSDNKELILSDNDTITVLNRMEVNNGDVGQGAVQLFDTLKVNSGMDNQSGSTDFIFIGGLTADYIDNGNKHTDNDTFYINKTTGTSLQFWDASGDGEVDLGDADCLWKLESGTLDFSTSNIDIDAYLQRTGGVMNSGSGTVNCSYTTDYSGGTFNHGNGTWVFDQSDDRNHTFTNVRDTFYNMTIDAASDNKGYNLIDTVTIANKLLVVQGDASGGIFEILDTMEITGINEQTSASGYKFVGNSNGTFYQNGDGVFKTDLYVAKSNNASVQFVSSVSTFDAGSSDNRLIVESGTADLSTSTKVDADYSEIQLDGGILKACSDTLTFQGDWDNNGGRFDHNNGTVLLDYENETWQSTVPDTFNVLILQGTGTGKEITAEADDQIIVENDLFLTQGEGFFNATVYPMGNITITSSNFKANSNQATLEFIGGNAQAIDFSASTSSYDGDITFNKTAGTNVTLNSDLTIDASGQTLTFTSGYLVTTTSNELVFPGNDGSCTGMSNASFVDGPVRKANTSAFTYPVGDNGVYGPITVQPVSGNGTEFRVEYVNATPTSTGNLGTGMHDISKSEYWDVTRTATSNSAFITIHWDSNRTGVPSSTSDLVVAHFTSGNWEDAGSNNLTGDVGSGSVRSDAVSSFSPFTLGAKVTTEINPLPVDLISFEAKANQEENVVDLIWITASEINNDYFTVERTKDLSEFEEVMTVTGQGTTNETTTYEERDYDPLPGVSYYRLSQTDFDGSTTQFDLAKVNFDTKASFDVQLYPNPNNGHNLFMKIPLGNADEMRVLVNDFLGKSHLVDFAVYDQGDHQLVVMEMTKKLPAGSYMVTIQGESETYSHKLIVR